ncbi:ATP-binding protein [Bifidobacterium oedipodis]|uniref:ATPase AAA n=1 Tax=Bifidobacterium oedipodis TaxID=2675322 RepID=A0A7Y0EQV4_9BIFI|nr:ATP-binding protein [Bifidobacterium sp. DSM 109957]NMM94752.1 ATPase AAA [Bifidobacterium sp. DSM 109957]
MLKRKATEKISFWKQHKGKQALLIDGARQVGKTSIIEDFGRSNYQHMVEINFVDNPDALTAVNNASTADDLFLAISAYADDELVPSETLIFLDEVQQCANVVTMIKFLVNRYGQYDYILSGSLLGVELKSVVSVPVGYLDSFTMYPMDFEEYCWARKVPQNVLQEVTDAYVERRPVNQAVHKRMTDLFHEYLLVGGMPDAVSVFIAEHNIQSLRARQTAIINRYQDDISQYADSLAHKQDIRRIFDLIPSELNQQNKRFRISSMDTHARMTRHENDFLWLADAGVAIPVYNVDEPRYPLMLSMNSRLFKLFLDDVGLLTCLCGMDIVRDLLNDRTDINYGALYENAIAQELKAHGFPLYYFKDNAIGELDFVIEHPRGRVMPIEVKAGKNYKRHSALTRALSTPNYDMEHGIVLAKANVETDGIIDYLPIYMVSQLAYDE